MSEALMAFHPRMGRAVEPETFLEDGLVELADRRGEVLPRTEQVART